MMLKTKFWAEMSWMDFQNTDMERVIAVLPVAAIEQHGPHLPVGVDTYIMEGYLRRAVERLPDDLPALFLPVQAIGKSNEHIAFPGNADAFGRDRAAGLDRDRRERVPRGLPQAGAGEFARRQHGAARYRGARPARAPRHAGRRGVLAPVRLSGRSLFRHRTHAWHPRGGCGNLAHAGLPAGSGQDGGGGGFRPRERRDRAGFHLAEGDPADRFRLDRPGRFAARAPWGTRPRPRPTRARPRPITAPRPLWNCCTMWMLSTCPAWSPALCRAAEPERRSRPKNGHPDHQRGHRTADFQADCSPPHCPTNPEFS